MIGQLLTGRYLILEKLGAGGFSETYLARDKYLPHHPLCVAKCLKLSPTNPIPLQTAQRLFKTEAQVLDELGRQQPQIPTLLAYSYEQDMAFQIQQYIEGQNLGQWLVQGRRFNSEAAIALLVDVLPVLQYVHSHHVIHRDIKPSNLIQSTHQNKIALIDFGASCRMVKTAAGLKLDGEDADLAIGTPGYMPREQQAGKLQFNSDLYALGVSVIFLLTGVHPRKLQPNPISGELDWQSHLGQQRIHPGLAMVLGGMIRCRASDRYQTAAEVMQAMEAFVSFSSPASVAPSPVSRFPQWKQVRRWSGRAKQSLLLTGVTLGLVGGGYFFAQSHDSQNFLARLGWHGAPAQQQLALLRSIPLTANGQPLRMAVSDRYLVTANSQPGVRVWSLPKGHLDKTLPGKANEVQALSLSRDGEWLVIGGRDRTAHLWHLTSGMQHQQFPGHPAPITAVAISPDAQTVASGSQDGTVRLWNCRTGVRKQTLARFGAAITAITYGVNSDLLISANSNYELQIWNLRTRQLQRTFAGHTAPILHLQMIDSKTLLSVGKDRTLVWNLNQEELMRSSKKRSTGLLAASVNARRVATVDEQGKVQIWNPDTGQSEATLAIGQPTLSAALSPAGRYLASWDQGQQLKLWQLNSD